MKLKNKITTIVNFLLVTIVLLVTSCVDGFKETAVFSSSVRNATLALPDTVIFAPSADGSTVTISWPVVDGAGGYQFTFYKMDDPTKPVAIGEENQVVDGCSVSRDLAEDTKYKVVIKTLGNTEYNNKGTETSKEISYSTLLATTATIPTGADLAQYFTQNPIPSSKTELAYQLEAGGSYTVSGNVPLGLTNVTIRGDKVSPATVKMVSGTFLSDGAGLKFKFINFDCSTFKGTGASIISFNSTLNSAANVCTWGTLITSPIALQACKITDLAVPLIFDNGKKYAMQTFLIKNCIIGQNTATAYNLIAMGGGYVKDLTITNSTIYNKQIILGGFLIQYANGTNATKITGSGWATGSVTLSNSTFWQVYPNTALTNYSGFASSSSNALSLQKCIFVDCDKIKSVSASLCVNSATPSRSFGLNTYWITSGTLATTSPTGVAPGCPLYEIYSSTYKFADNSGTVIQSDPQFQDPANANFKVLGTAQISAQTGDPRWLQ